MANETTPESEFAGEKLDESQSHFQQAADDLKTAASAKYEDLKNKANDLKSAANAKVEDFKGIAAAKADELRAAAAAKADEYYAAANAKAEEFRGQAEAAWGDAKVKARTYHEDSEQYVRENPTRALLIALGAGFLLGLIVRK